LFGKHIRQLRIPPDKLRKPAFLEQSDLLTRYIPVPVGEDVIADLHSNWRTDTLLLHQDLKWDKQHVPGIIRPAHAIGRYFAVQGLEVPDYHHVRSLDIRFDAIPNRLCALAQLQ